MDTLHVYQSHFQFWNRWLSTAECWLSEWYHTILSLSVGICISLLLLGALVDSHFMDFRRFPKPQEKSFLPTPRL